jgi:signal recognition particle subunit SRP54
VEFAREHGHDVVVLDTAGRLHVDRELMDEVTDVARKVAPHEVFLVLDAMTGQDAVNSAKAFDEALPLTGVVLTKLDGDTRGGAALSVRAVTGKPIRFVGTGEKPENLEPFHADRLASRILGMGDVVSLVERAQETIDEAAAQQAAEKMFAGTFTMDDMLAQFEQIERLGPLKQVLGMLPGISGLLGEEELDEKPLRRAKAIIQSMTPRERLDPEVLDPSRRRRVARGSGTSLEEVNRLVKAFRQTRGAFKKLRTEGGIRGKMAGRQFDRMKQRQLEELRRRGIDPRDLGLPG